MVKDFSCEHIFDSDGKIVESLLTFSFITKETLNSNSLPSNTFYLSKLRKNLRQKASEMGSNWHPNPTYAQLSCEYNQVVSNKSSAKSRATRSMNKDGLNTQEQTDVLSAIDEEYEEDIQSLNFIIDKKNDLFLFDKCHISIGVSPPTKRICDPPNYYPTIKPIIDGLTDALWWEDDNFNYITSTEFHYATANLSGKYQFFLKIKRV